MPFRLLGVVADPSQASDLCGHAFARYAASGTDVTLVCAAAQEWGGPDQKSAARRLGVRDLVLLDYRLSELTAAVLVELLADLMASVRPHVVVADGRQPAVRDAVGSAFARIRQTAGGSSALPAKLYYRSSPNLPVSVTTSVTVVGGAPELFVRVFPDPWVTGVLERDLFAGVPTETQAPSRVDQQMAS